MISNSFNITRMTTTKNTTRTKKTTTVQRTNIFQRIENTKGRFFGLYLSSGEKINAQYRSQTDSYLRIYDRNRQKNRMILKTTIIRATV